MANEEIPLNDAPDVFFDQTKWGEFVSLFGDRRAALVRISRIEPGLIGYMRAEAAKMSTPEGAKARKDEHIAELGNALVARFKARLIKEEVVASGFSSLSVDRVKIPGERWPDLWPNFCEDKAEGKGLTFTNVRVFESGDGRTSPTSLADECVVWMRERQLAGENRRKTLEHEAQKRFGSALTSREFAVAYKTVFGKSRGRPRKISPK